MKMSNYQILSEQIEKLNEELKNGHQTIGALHVLVRVAIAEAESANATDACKTLNIADNLILRGYLHGGKHNGDIVFGRE